ncbi:sulfonate transport system substrate-binding protein [Pseudomonas cedrina]|nr:sulfonate transport system substrate-binding protein [Pseudomonas cedrina]
MRTVILRRGLVALFAAAVSFGVIVQAQAAETLRIGYQKYGTLVLLKAKGTLEKRLAAQGVNVQWTEFPGGPQLLEGLNVGSIDFGVTGETPPVFAQAAGADLLYVAYEPPAPTSEAILVPKDSPIKSVAELKGKKVVLNKGSNVHYLLVRALEDAGLKYTDVHTVFLPPADARAAFERGSVDAWVIWDPYQAAAEKQLQARTLRDGTGIADNHQFYLATKPYAEQHPEVIQALVEEVRAVGEWAKAQPRTSHRASSAAAGAARRCHLDLNEAPRLRCGVPDPGSGRRPAENRRHLLPTQIDPQALEHQGRDLDTARRRRG